MTILDDVRLADFIRRMRHAKSTPRASIEITPPHLTRPVLNFCGSVSSERPLAVHRIATPDAETDCSLSAVTRRIQSRGGTPVLGWMIKCAPGLWATAEFRVVWRSEDKRLLDVTADDEPANTIVFIPGSRRLPSLDPSGRHITLHERLLTNEPEIEIFEAFVASLEPHLREETERAAQNKGLTLRQAVRPLLDCRSSITRRIDDYLEAAGALAAMTLTKSYEIAQEPSDGEYRDRCVAAARIRDEIIEWAELQLRLCEDPVVKRSMNSRAPSVAARRTAKEG
jgi:hypothetical protein